MYSHQLAVLTMFCLVQQNGSSKEEFERYLPELPQEQQNVPLLIKNYVREDAEQSSKKKSESTFLEQTEVHWHAYCKSGLVLQKQE